jgi:hypothetical protein
MLRHLFLALLSFCLLACVNGCEEDAKAPDRTEPEILLGPGWSSAEWYLEDSPCPGESYCLNHLLVTNSLQGPASVTVTVEGVLGSVKQSAMVTEADFTAFFELVEQTVFEAIRDRDGEHSGCEISGGYSEAIGFFAGDAGFSVFIGGCTDENVTEIRRKVLEITAKYFPGDEVE